MKYKHSLIIVFLILILDQWSKIYIKTHFNYGESVPIIGTWFQLLFIENEGMAFGMKLMDSSLGKLLLTSFRLVAVSFGFYWIRKMIIKGATNGLIICASLILAGAAGNLTDSVFYGKIFTESYGNQVATLVGWGEGYGDLLHGKVVDMLYFPLIDTVWPECIPWIGGNRFRFFEPVFNIADVAISTGIITLLVFQKKFIPQLKEESTTKNEH